MEYGSYDPYHFCVESVAALGDGLDESGIAAFVASHPSVDDQVDRAMRDVTLLHELRHLHDAFGTISGLTFFDTHISRLHAFLEVLKRLHQDKVRIRLPLHEWAESPSCPDFVQEFARRIAFGLVADAVFLGRTKLAEGLGSPDQVSIDMNLAKFRFPAFPREYRNIDLAQGQRSTTSAQTIAIPIGLEQLVEGNAQSLQRALLQAAWPREVEERVLDRMRVLATTRAMSSSAVRSFMAVPYNVTDHMLTRHLKLRFGIGEFPRSRLTELTDQALMVGSSLPYGLKGEILLPGGAFVTLMETVDWKMNIDRPLFQEPEHDTAPMLARFIKALEEEPPPSTYLKTDSAHDAIGACYSFARRHITLPLFKLRMKHGPAALNSLEGYLQNYAQLPVAPVAISPKGIARGPGVTDRMLRAWTRYVMFSQLSLQIWRGGRTLMCPRAARLVPGLQYVDYNHPIGCDIEEANGRCTEWEPGDTREVPECHFFFLLKMLGLR